MLMRLLAVLSFLLKTSFDASLSLIPRDRFDSSLPLTHTKDATSGKEKKTPEYIAVATHTVALCGTRHLFLFVYFILLLSFRGLSVCRSIGRSVDCLFIDPF